MDHAQARALLDKQFEEGVLASHQAEALRIHLRACATCRAEYDRLVELEQHLAGNTPVARTEIERLLALGPPVEEAARPTRWLVPALAGAAAAAAAILLIVTAKPPEFSPRGAAPSGRTAWIRIFEKTPTGTAPLGATLSADRGLLFSYTNLRDSDHHHLAIAGRDATGHLRWYHPSYEAAQSMAIETGVADRELQEVIYHAYPPGPLEICAIFTSTPADIKQLDTETEKTGRWPATAAKDCHTVQVTETQK